MFNRLPLMDTLKVTGVGWVGGGSGDGGGRGGRAGRGGKVVTMLNNLPQTLTFTTNQSYLLPQPPPTLAIQRCSDKARWTMESGWGAPHITPFQNISLPPSATVFHYGLEASFV